MGWGPVLTGCLKIHNVLNSADKLHPELSHLLQQRKRCCCLVNLALSRSTTRTDPYLYIRTTHVALQGASLGKHNVADWWHNSQLEDYQTIEDPAAPLSLFLGHYRILCSQSYPGSSSTDYSWVSVMGLERLSTVITSPCTGWRRPFSNPPFWHEPGKTGPLR